MCPFSRATGRGKVGAKDRRAALFFAALFWASPWARSPAQEAPPSPQVPPSEISEGELSRLVEISTRLSALTEKLKSELEDSKRSSDELAISLEISRSGLEALRTELDCSRRSSIELASRAENSERASIELREALRKAEDSLRSSEKSFGEFKGAAESALRKERTRTILAAAAAALGWAVALFALVFT